MRTVLIASDKTATSDELRNGNVLALAAGVAYTLPYPSSDFTDVTIKPLGAGCSVVSAAGIETADGATSTSAIELAPGDALRLFSYRDKAAGTQSAYLLAGMPAGIFSRNGRYAPVRLMSAASLAAYTASAAGVLTADANGALTVDGVAVAEGDRIGLKDAAAGANNGIFVVTATGDGSNPYILTPAEDFNSAADITLGGDINVLAGTANAKKRFMVTAFAGTYLTDSVTIEAGA